MYIKEVHVHTDIHYNFVNGKKSDTQQKSKKTLPKDLLIGGKISIEKIGFASTTKCCIYKFSHFLINHNFDPCPKVWIL